MRPEQVARQRDGLLGGGDSQEIGHLATDPGELALGKVAALALKPGQCVALIDGAGKVGGECFNPDGPHRRERGGKAEGQQVLHLAERASIHHGCRPPVDLIVKGRAIGNYGDANDAGAGQYAR